MRVTNYKSLYQLTIMPNLFPVNVYLIEEEKSFTLIDTGLPSMVSGIIKFARENNKPIETILLTHCHDDHIGGLDALRQQLPDAKVIVPKRESRFLMGDMSLDQSEPQSPLKGGYPKKRVTYFDETLVEGNMVGSLSAVFTPGHTPGLTSYWHEKDKIMIVGDALQTQGGVAVAGTLIWTFPFPAMATWHKQMAIQSVEKLLAFNADVIAPGHGKLLHSPNHSLLAALQIAKNKL